MPSFLGSLLASYCLSHSTEIQATSPFVLFLGQVLASIALALGFMPTTFYSLLAGYFFGWSSIPYLFVSYMLASVCGYYLCMWLDRGHLRKVLNERYPVDRVVQKLSGSGIGLAAFCRLSPTLPFAILNAIFAMVQYPFYSYFIGGFIGMLPRTLFAVYLGQKFQHVTSLEDMQSEMSTWFAVVMALFSFVGIGWIVKKKLF